MRKRLALPLAALILALASPVWAQQPIVVIPVDTTGAAIVPVSSAAAESNHVLKATAGNLYSLSVTTGASGGYLMAFNATSAPTDGAVTPVGCWVVGANSTLALSWNPGPPDFYSTAITVVFSTTGCFTKTASATAFFKGQVK